MNRRCPILDKGEAESESDRGCSVVWLEFLLSLHLCFFDYGMFPFGPLSILETLTSFQAHAVYPWSPCCGPPTSSISSGILGENLPGAVPSVESENHEG